MKQDKIVKRRKQKRLTSLEEMDENGELLTQKCSLCHRSRPVYAGDE